MNSFTMNKRNSNPEDAARLRQMAEEKLKKQKTQVKKTVSEAEKLKLIHELQVHQIELELQNEELVIAKEKAEQAEKIITELYDFAPSGYFTLNKEGNIVQLNLTGAKMLGKERGRLIDVRFALFLTNETRTVFQDFIDKIYKSKTMISCEVAIGNNGLPRKYLYLTATLDVDENHCLLTASDISQKKLAEKALEESEQRYALVIDASEQGIWDWNTETNEVFYSKQWKKQIGYEDDEIENNFDSWIDHLHPDEKEDCRRAIQAYLNNPVEHFFLEFRFRHKDGSYRWMNTKAASILNENGKVVRMFGTHTDITDKKNADIQIKIQNEELQQLNATKSKFFSIIAHDLKSPFNSIMGFSELLVEQIKEKNFNGTEKYAEIILLSSRRAINLLRNLMEWARSQTGQIKFYPKRFDLSAFMIEATQMFDDIAGQKDIKLKKEFPIKALVFADQAMVNTVLRNLISNAIKFTKPGGVITISVKEEKNECVVAVKDNGIGIPESQINKLFRIDENYSTRGTANETGTGLGLILCKEFIEKHHGKIRVESEEGKGSTFYFTLPYHAEPAA